MSTELSEAKRALLEKMLRGDMPQTTQGIDAIPTIPQRTEETSIPLSFAQQQMWVLAQIIPDTPVYNEGVTVHIPGPLASSVLEQSLNEVIRRHEAWRTNFLMRDGLPVQVTSPSLTVSLPLIDVRHLPQSVREAEALRLATEDVKRPFDLAHGPLLRATLVRLDDSEHRLFLTMHHIIFDGTSVFQNFLTELSALYAALSAGQPAQLAVLPIQYADFAVWQRKELQENELADQLAYWKQQLTESQTSLELPTDHPRPSTPSYRGSVQSFLLPRQVGNALKALSRREGVTLYMTLLAAFNMLIQRYSGQDDILVGTIVAGRKQAELQKLLGVFINTLVMRTNLAGNPRFLDLLTRVRNVTVEAQDHQDVPFERLVQELQPRREQGQNPLFQVLFLLEPQMAHLASGWSLTHMDVTTDTAKFDLSLIVDDRAEGLLCRFEYSTDLFDAATIVRMAGHWQTLLEGIVAAPEQPIAKLPLLTKAEQHQLLVEWNATRTAYPKDQCVHQLFEAQVERTPDAVALVLDEQVMSYRELNIRANQLAYRLRTLGVQSEVLVGLCMERSIEMVVAMLGILKAGGAYLPLDLAYPKERLALMLEDTRATVLLTQERYLSVLPTQGMHVLCLDTQWQEIAQEHTDNVVSTTTAENLAYVMYTSGSTGKPKGVEIIHRNINRLVFGVEYAQLDATQTILHMAPISFDASTLELWGALLHGARCVLLPERIPSVKSIGQVVHKHAVTTAWLTASLFNAVVDEAPEALTGIKQLLTGGEALSVTHIRRALERLPSTHLVNGYGPHESTTFACCYPIPKQLSEHIHSIPIGRPIGNTQVYVLDRHLNPVPIGVPGELHIGGAGLARGYLNQPELTNEKFIAHPFSDEPEARLYKTGDLVRYLPDGNIEFLGRLDQQIKIRGYRIEPEEIKVVLGNHPAVREVLILVDENQHKMKRLIAYIVCQQGQHVTVNELRRFLREKLPEYMVPSTMVLLDAMPITPNGKVDIHALPAPTMVRQAEQEALTAPLLTVHHQLIQMWEDVLHVRPIGIHDNFFELGGHSLLAAGLFDTIEQVFGKKLPLATFFAGATIEYLVDALLGEQTTRSRAPVVAVQASGSKRPFFFLHGDWFGGGFYCLNLSRHLGPDQPFYVLEPYNFEGLPIPPTFEEMATAHIEALRTIQPQGPYLLGGFCNGGLMAYEMARQLHAQGQTVDFLIMIDPASPTPHKTVRNTINRVGWLMHQGQEKQLDWFLLYIYSRIGSYRAKVQDAMKALPSNQDGYKRKRGKAGALRAKIAAKLPSSAALRYPWAGIYRWVAAGYVPGRYPGKLTFFWSSEKFAENVHWRTLSGAKDSTADVFPGTHLSSRNENLHVLAERLRICLNEAQTAN